MEMDTAEQHVKSGLWLSKHILQFYILEEFHPNKTRTSSSKGPNTSLPMMVGFEEETSPC
jgi:hypothetical protein